MTDEVSDPTDWHATSLPFLAQFDAGLRCQVCKDYFASAVITTCSHTFCSLCIRRCLSAEGRCPTCRTNEQETRLRKNVAVQELTDMFVAARPDALKRSREVLEREESQTTQEAGRERKRKRGEGSTVNGNASPPRRRSHRLQSGIQGSPPPQDIITLDDDLPQENHHGGNDGAGDEDYEPEDGLVPCPICHKRMKAEAVFSHLDTCDGGQSSNDKRRSSHPLSRSHTTTPIQNQQEPKPPPERLPQINYSLLKDNALRKKLSELSISSSGPRPLLIRRHTEWINLWNANCDSARPRSRRELLADLDAWERSQGSFAANGGQPQTAAVMRKDFDGVAWAKKNKDDFSSLIAAARRKREQPAAEPATTNTTTSTTYDASIHPPHSHPATHNHAETSVPSQPTNGNSSPHPNSHPTFRRPSIPHPDHTSSIFPPPHPHPLETQRSATRSPVPGFSFEKSIDFGGREPPPGMEPPAPCLHHNGSQQSDATGINGNVGGDTPDTWSPPRRRGSRTGWAQFAESTPLQTQNHAQGRRLSGTSDSLMGLQTTEALPKTHPHPHPHTHTHTGRERSTASTTTADANVERIATNPSMRGVKKMPMFEVPADPITDAEMGGTK